MEVYLAEFDGRCGRGCCDDSYSVVVVANTKAEALGLLLDSRPDSAARDWSMQRIDTSKPNIHDA